MSWGTGEGTPLPDGRRRHPMRHDRNATSAGRRTHRKPLCRDAGNVVVPALLLLLGLAGALGWNYHRNYQLEQQQAKSRPFSALSTQDLALMAAGYRQELAGTSVGSGAKRVATTQRYHFGDQVKEFERVQRETRRVRDRQTGRAQIEADLAQLEAEQLLRANSTADAVVHLTRLFSI